MLLFADGVFCSFLMEWNGVGHDGKPTPEKLFLFVKLGWVMMKAHPWNVVRIFTDFLRMWYLCCLKYERWCERLLTHFYICMWVYESVLVIKSSHTYSKNASDRWVDCLVSWLRGLSILCWCIVVAGSNTKSDGNISLYHRCSNAKQGPKAAYNAYKHFVITDTTALLLTAAMEHFGLKDIEGT